MPTMTPVSAGGAPYQVPPEPSRWPSIALAAAVHAGLLAFLYIGVNWQNTQPVQVEAEVWDMKTQSAAPPPPPPEVVEPAPAPVPVPKVVEPPPPPPKVEQPAAPKPPDIALEREKQKAEKRKLLEEKKLEEQKLAKERKAEELADRKAEKQAQELADRKAEKKAQELADKKAAQKAQELADKKLEEKKLADKLKADKLAKAKEAADDQKRLDKVRADEMRRITSGAGESGEAPKSTASRLDTSYLAAINSKIKGSTSYAGSTEVPGKPEVVFTIEQLPTGEIISVRLKRSSGIPAFDDAVEKGILKSSPLPKNKNGTVLRTLEIAFAMKDLK